MTPAARTAGGPSTTLPVSVTMVPRAEPTSELNHTVRPSYRAPWTWILFSAAGSLAAMAIISSHVLGGVGTRSLRYQRSWVFEVNGIAHSLPMYSAVLRGPSSVPAVAFVATAPVSGLIHPAWANSAVQMTSMPMTSMSESLAAKRRTTSSRCWSALVGRSTVSIR